MRLQAKTRLISKIVLIFCLAISLGYLGAVFSGDKKPDIEAEAKVDRPSLKIGDKFKYSLIVKAKKDIEIEFPQIRAEDLSVFAIRDFGKSEKEFWGKKTIRHWYILDTYISGEYTIPGLTIRYRRLGSDDWQQLSVNEVKLKVQSVLDQTPYQTDIRDIRGPKDFGNRFFFYLILSLVGLIILGITLGLVFFKKKNSAEKMPPVPAHIIAYEALSALEKKDYISKGEFKEYYTELSDIVRHYLENRFNIRAPEMTTEEFLMKTKDDNNLSSKHKSLLRDFLFSSDLVKFAKHRPAQEEAVSSLSLAKKLIDETKETTSSKEVNKT